MVIFMLDFIAITIITTIANIVTIIKQFKVAVLMLISTTIIIKALVATVDATVETFNYYFSINLYK